jgi:hypothetical protein
MDWNSDVLSTSNSYQKEEKFNLELAVLDNKL